MLKHRLHELHEHGLDGWVAAVGFVVAYGLMLGLAAMACLIVPWS